MVTHLEKRIYNTYLAISRSKQNKPFKLRQDFKKFEEDPNYTPIKKLANFFDRHQNVNINDYFIAPYAIYKNDVNAFYDLKFYLSAKARNIYTMYMKRQDTQHPDSQHIIKKCKDSMHFIYKYCKDNSITLDQYLSQKTSGIIPDFGLHLKDRKVNIYTLFAFDSFEKKFYEIPKDMLAFMFGEIYNDFARLRMRYLQSEDCKRVCKSGLNEIKKILEKKLKRN